MDQRTGQTSVCVIVPFFQNTRGLLKRALRSVFSQDATINIQVVVVDDGSPQAAREEIVELESAQQGRIQLIEVPNGGVAKARNIGLDHIPNETRWVAFLDSDDEWAPDHLRRALALLGESGAFFFADHIREGWTSTAFQRCRTFSFEAHEHHQALSDGYRFSGNAFLQVLRNNMIGTSTVVYRFDHFRELRFDEAFTRSGEDIFFWLSLLSECRAVVFSNKLACRYFPGVNICSGARWGTPSGIQVTLDDLLLLQKIRNAFSLSDEECSLVHEGRKELLHELVGQVLHNVRRGRLSSIGSLGKCMARDPATLVPMVSAATALFFGTSEDGG